MIKHFLDIIWYMHIAKSVERIQSPFPKDVWLRSTGDFRLGLF